MSEASGESWASIASQPWRPRSLAVARKASPGLIWRALLLLGIVLLHLIAARYLVSMLAAEKIAGDDEVVLLLDFSEPPPRSLPARPPQALVPPAPTTRPSRARDKREDTRGQTPSNVAPPPVSAKRPPIAADGPIQLYQPDGRLRTPEDMLEQIDRQSGETRVFSYQVPRMDDAKKYFYRNRALTFESTRFDQYWTPPQDMLTGLLTKLVEETTKEVTLSIPGHPDSKVVCTVALLAFSGGCGILTNGTGYVGPLDDPATLNPDEDRQCQAWWEQIVAAKTQDLWRKTRSLYEAQCRKPLARKS